MKREYLCEWILVFVVFIIVNIPVLALNNGLALTPPMGWLSWERFRCNVDCKKYPKDCISEELFIEMADRIVSDGFKDAGYEYINIDDCWMKQEREPDGRLEPDPERFPHGIKFLADYMHSKGLKLGIYQDFGTYTCMGYPGIVNYMEQDAKTFAEWGVDMLKLDGCHSHPKDMDKGYILMGNHLNHTGHRMVYSCSWPFYQLHIGMEPNYALISKHCNLWRNFDDIQDSWDSIQKIIDFYGDNQEVMAPHAGPGHWNDPDMIIIGNYGLSYDQAKAQMAVWAVLAAPLLMSNDLRNLHAEFKDILQNKGVIAVNQDPLGIQGKRIFKKERIEIWRKPITPIIHGYHSFALLFLNRRTDGTPTQVKTAANELGLLNPSGYHVVDLFDGGDYGIVAPADHLSVMVNPTGVTIVKATALK
ncbi:alpha-N-acetylgalactosaminidase-like [Limulus polyphemus]|uniref:Alpha-galactosidase n=1 Tax=Limulus polyphemus TaxID=6850 RepID=A0ABM1TKR6_LIMPO|nr:alpha-N-acetylgalactosaminidase-like [Limulus polyphemus]XP_013788249.1 alpha-N-acetylgalactosaminidase-like [Limulus polyphemus]XP_022256472.1 alpha-N-acetylgalactosaminidase-like [Limulus polyphemus]XP_022256474.1 alpha-N-acetylgalactosaminidase-like [Limulus polyphemus]XP_022256475.1 alpha-N-acetylgalactosaminidase-like [Limulus polyphemus]XP_022256476.1 alpha-N-acetylgalactosaminidase-like [Limulus polyphemus]XP_022256477.1 alpha-N-acetylgalactosaminidase-like [Limulus polyphemus]